ncbi:MAG: STAS domain-containing protein, partial [Campylobacterota bacterium]|nr:STAS domain-containing protein [Campylobacterota bacterium]
MQTEIYEENDLLIVTPSGKLDTIRAPEFGKELASLLEKKPKRCLIDMSQVVFLSSSGLQVLLAGAKISKKEHITFGVFGMNEMLNDVFCLSGFNNFIASF